MRPRCFRSPNIMRKPKKGQGAIPMNVPQPLQGRASEVVEASQGQLTRTLTQSLTQIMS